MRQKNGYEGTDFKFEVISYVEVNVRTELGGEMILPTQRWESELRKGVCSWEGRQMAKQQRPRPQGLPSEQTQRESGKQTQQLKKWESQVKRFSKWENDSNKIKSEHYMENCAKIIPFFHEIFKSSPKIQRPMSLSGFTINKQFHSV